MSRTDHSHLCKKMSLSGSGKKMSPSGSGKKMPLEEILGTRGDFMLADGCDYIEVTRNPEDGTITIKFKDVHHGDSTNFTLIQVGRQYIVHSPDCPDLQVVQTLKEELSRWEISSCSICNGNSKQDDGNQIHTETACDRACKGGCGKHINQCSCSGQGTEQTSAHTSAKCTLCGGKDDRQSLHTHASRCNRRCTWCAQENVYIRKDKCKLHK
jgi:hypothetical protein